MMMVEPGEVAIVAIVFGTSAFTLLSLARMRLRGKERSNALSDPAVDERLYRIEQAVDAMALEMAVPAGLRAHEKASASATIATGSNRLRKRRVFERSVGEFGMRRSLRCELLTEIRFFNPGIAGKVLRWAFHHDSTRFEHVRAIGVAQRGVRILFD